MKRHTAVLLFITFASLANAQTFDAASLKADPGKTFIPRVTGTVKGGPGTGDPGRIAYTQVRLLELLLKAWDLQTYQLSGPPWLREVSHDGSDMYTLAATMPPGTTQQQFHSMLQNLFVERFRMQFHHETRNMTGYELAVAPGGSKLKVTTQDPDAPELSPQTGVGKDYFSILPPGHAAGVVMANGGVHFKCQSYTLAEFIRYLPGFINQSGGGDFGPLMDKTGLTGKYDFTLEFDARGGGSAPVVSPNIQPLADRSGDTDPGGYPNLFRALEKQLGLKLVKVKDVPVDVLAIDRIEKVPLEN